MSIFNEILEKVNEITSEYANDFQLNLQNALAALDKFGEEYMKSKGAGSQKGKNAILQSINEDEDEATKAPQTTNKRRSSKTKPLEQAKPTEKLPNNVEEPVAASQRSKKRSKDEVDGMCSPEQDKRPKRNASVRAQGNISKQVNVNLTSKLRREDSKRESRGARKGQTDADSDKENSEPLVKVKEEKVSLPPAEPMDTLDLNVGVKQEPTKDDMCMPPPALPVPKPRGRAAAKERQKEKELEREREKADESSEEESSGRRRNTKNRKQTDTMPPPAVASSRSTRASSRASSKVNVTQQEDMPPPPPPPVEARPKRTRAKKKTDSESSQPEPEKTTPQENGVASPTEKPRPKRTRRGKAAQKEETVEPPKPEAAKEPATISPKEERISIPTDDSVSSPILSAKTNLSHKDSKARSKKLSAETADQSKPVNLEETRIISASEMNVTVDICNGHMDQTVTLLKGKYQAASEPKKAGAMDETVVLESNARGTFAVENPPRNHVNDTTVVIEKQSSKITDDNSLMTDDNSDHEPTTPPRPPPQLQPSSAVKEKVQQFEELASRVTRTKTRAMAKKDPLTPEEEENHTPTDKISKAVLSADTLAKMNSLIFNGKPAAQISTSASKPRANIVTSMRSLIPASTSKLSGLVKAKEAAEEGQRKEREKENAKKKKDALLEARKEAQRRKREEKMAAAAAAREAAERDRQLAIEAAARERMEKQAQADMGKLERAKEQERKKLELLRKAAVTEERRLAEERARHQRLAEEQKRAELARRKQHEEQEAMKKEAAYMAKEIEKRQKEYLEKQKLKQKMDAEKAATPLKTPGGHRAGHAMEPVHMADGFEQLHSDSDSEDAPRWPAPLWSTSKVRLQQLKIQSYIKQSHIDRLFSVRTHSPDLRDIFPDIARRHLKRTSSAVWRTPPHRLQPLQE